MGNGKVTKTNPINVAGFSSELGDDRTLYKTEDPDVIDYIHRTVLAVMKDGWGIVQVCVVLEIATSTFYYWRKKHPAFEAVYQKGLLTSVDSWDRFGKGGITQKFFNEKLYTRIRANHHYEYYSEYGRPKINEFTKCKTAAELGEAIKNALGEGRLSPDEALKISQTFSNMFSLKERTELEERLVEIEKHMKK